MMKLKFDWVRGLGALLLALLLVGGFWVFTREKPAEETPEQTMEDLEGDPYLLTLLVTQSMEDSYNDLKVGDTLYFTDRKGFFGEITDLKLVDRQVELQHEGQYLVGIDPDDQWIRVQVKTKGIRKPSEFKVGKNALTVGQVLYPETDRCRVAATVMKIEESAK